MLKSDKRVILVDKVDGKSAKNFRQLSAVLDKMKIFVPKTVGAKTFRYGLEIVENEFLRFYPYGDLLEPVLGYAKLETMEGLLGVEKFYDNSLPEIILYSKTGEIKFTIKKGEWEKQSGIVNKIFQVIKFNK